MTGQQIYDACTTLNNGQNLDQTWFLNALQQEQSIVEAEREWFILKKQDTTKTLLSTDTFKTSKALPLDFNFWQEERPIVLVDPTNTNNFQDYWVEVPFSNLITYQNYAYRYAVDLLNSQMFFSGPVDRTYTIYMNYISKPAAVTLVTSWVFPSQYHMYLVHAILAVWKEGGDYDDVNARQAVRNDKDAKRIMETMEKWDARLQTAALRGVERGINMNQTWYGGRVPIDR